MMNRLTENARELFPHYPKCKLNQSNTMKLSRMELGKQKQEKKFSKANDELTETNLAANRVMAPISPA